MVGNSPVFPQDIYKQHLQSVKGVYFTKREVDIISCLVSAKRGSEIAQLLSLAKPTVTTHLRNIMQKIQCNTQGGIVSFFQESPVTPLLRDYFGKMLVELIFSEQMLVIQSHRDEMAPSKSKAHLTWQDIQLKEAISSQLSNDLKQFNIEVVSSKDLNKSADFVSFLITSSLPSNPESTQNQETKLLINPTDIYSYYLAVLKIASQLTPGLTNSSVISSFESSIEKVKYMLVDTPLDIYPSLSQGAEKNKQQSTQQSYYLGWTSPRKIVISVLLLLLFAGVLLYAPLHDAASKQASHLGSLSSYTPQILTGCEIFIGREKQLKEIKELFKNNQVVILSGRSGVGKTTCAVEYGKRLSKSQLVIYFDADDAFKISHQYRNILEMFNVSTSSLTKTSEIRSMNSLFKEYNKSITLIFDNVEAYDSVKDYISSLPTNVKVLITTTHPMLAEGVPLIKLHQFTREESGRYIRAFLKNHNLDPQFLETLIDHSGALPYNLKRATAYFVDNPLSNLETLSFNFKLFEQFITSKAAENELAWEILQYAVHMDPDFIPLEVFKEILTADTSLINRALKKLESQSFISVVLDSKGKKGIKIHRNLITEVKNSMNYFHKNSTPRPLIIERLLRSFDKMFPVVNHRPGPDWVVATHLLPQMQSIVKLSASEKIQNNRLFARIMYKLGAYYSHVQIDRTEALKYATKALELIKHKPQRLPPSEVDVLDSLGLIYLYKSDETAPKGLKLLKKSLMLANRHYGPSDPKIAKSLRHISLAYLKFKDFKTSLHYALENLKMCRKLSRNSDKELIPEALNDVAWVLYEMKRFEEALEYSQQAVNSYIALKEGKSHVVYALHTLGALHLELKHYTKAADALLRALEISREFRMHNHYVTAISYHDLGETYFAQQQLEKALPCFEKSLKILTELRENTQSDFYDLTKDQDRIAEIGSIKKDHGSKSLFSRLLTWI